ncbi:MAG: hypothetical protein IJ642_12170 [Oscillospiraceae bacterium]|nr:hypothetical protein [Oscillospiraceae bacterium]
MISVEEACKAAQKVFKFRWIGNISETPKHFLISDCGENGETKYTSILFSVDKRTGKVDDYFPPDHYDEFIKAVPVEIPEQYRVKTAND